MEGRLEQAEHLLNASLALNAGHPEANLFAALCAARRGDDATAVCSFAAKKSTNCVRTFAAGHSPITVASCRRTCGRSAVRSRPAAGRIIDAVHSRAPTSMLRRGDVQAIWAAAASELVGALW